jgi:hypothetical protein
MDINFQLEEKIRIIIENKVPENEFNEFAINFYLLTKKIMISLNKFLNIREIRNPKILQVKNAGELLYISRDSIRIIELLKNYGYMEIPLISPQIAYYVIKRNKYTIEQNWENIIEVLKEEQYPSRFMNTKKIILTEEQKTMVKKEVQNRFHLRDFEINHMVEMLKRLKVEDKELFEKFKAIF